MTRGALSLVFVLGLTAASAAGLALGVIAAVTVDRARVLLGEWDDVDE